MKLWQLIPTVRLLPTNSPQIAITAHVNVKFHQISESNQSMISIIVDIISLILKSILFQNKNNSASYRFISLNFLFECMHFFKWRILGLIEVKNQLVFTKQVTSRARTLTKECQLPIQCSFFYTPLPQCNRKTNNELQSLIY